MGKLKERKTDKRPFDPMLIHRKFIKYADREGPEETLQQGMLERI